MAVQGAEMAAMAAARLGYPVVVKPLDQAQGVGVHVRLKDAEAVRRAYAEARTHSDKALVESHVEGRDHRMVIFRGRLIWAPGAFHGPGGGRRNQLRPAPRR